MSVICLDNNLLIWGVQQISNPSQKEMIKKSIAIIECIENKNAEQLKPFHKIIIPSIVLGEFLVGCKDAQVKRDFFKKIQTRFRVIEYTPIAAKLYSDIYQYLPNQQAKQIIKNDGITRANLKADLMIYATALSCKTSCIVTHDKGMQVVSEYMPDSHAVPVKLINDLVYSDNTVNEQLLFV